MATLNRVGQQRKKKRMSINDGNVDSYLKSNFNLGTEDDKPSVSILKATSSISKHGDVVTFREEVRTRVDITHTHTKSYDKNDTHRERKSFHFIPISAENTENC